MNKTDSDRIKVPAVTLLFWIIKILATTLGETGGDTLSMSLDFGYLASTLIFFILFVVIVFIQIKARGFHPALYWTTITFTTILGTTLADFLDRSLGIGYSGGTAILLLLLLTTLLTWRISAGSISVQSVSSQKTEIFYWITIMFSQTLGTALGDWLADTRGFGYQSSSILVFFLLLVVAFAYYKTKISPVILFWTAFILTRPLGAVIGDLLDKPLNQGGMDLSRFSVSAVILISMIILIFISRRVEDKRRPRFT